MPIGRLLPWDKSGNIFAIFFVYWRYKEIISLHISFFFILGKKIGVQLWWMWDAFSSRKTFEAASEKGSFEKPNYLRCNFLTHCSLNLTFEKNYSERVMDCMIVRSILFALCSCKYLSHGLLNRPKYTGYLISNGHK